MHPMEQPAQAGSTVRNVLLVVAALIAAASLFLLGLWFSAANASDVSVQSTVVEATQPGPPEPEAVAPELVPAPEATPAPDVEPGSAIRPVPVNPRWEKPLPDEFKDLLKDFDLDRFFEGEFRPDDLFGPEFQAELDEFFANPPVLPDGVAPELFDFGELDLDDFDHGDFDLEDFDHGDLWTPEFEAQIEEFLGREFNLDDFGFGDHGFGDSESALGDAFWRWVEELFGATLDA